MLGWYGEGPLDALCARLAGVEIAPGAEQAFTRLAQRGVSMSDVAAVGDSPGDVPMLAAVGRPIFVGTALPAEIPHSLHVPNADLRDIADLILAR
jgi:phosphoserine phosphatase